MTLNHVSINELLGFIRRCVANKKAPLDFPCKHASQRQVHLATAILDSCSSYEIIEQYPGDKYFPSYLLRSEYLSNVFHILCAVDVEGENVRIVTAYRPDPEEWDEGLRNRRHAL